jgi:mRNA-degrading endonuclease RelE of RelBE toxin-antitoxin system
VIETPTFQKQADAIWTPQEREAFIDFIAEYPDAGDVISGAEGARKVRWQRKGTGKRGGARVIYFHLVGDEVVLLVMVYAKAERSNVKPKDIKRS